MSGARDKSSLDILLRNYRVADNVEECFQIFTEIEGSVGGLIEHWASQYLTQKADVPDVMQEVRLKLVQNLGKIDEERSLFSWCHVTTRNLCFNQNKKRRPLPFDQDELEKLSDETRQIKSFEFNQSDIDLILSKLSDECRRLLGMYYLDAEAYRRYGESHNLNDNAVQKRASRCRDEAILIWDKLAEYVKPRTSI